MLSDQQHFRMYRKVGKMLDKLAQVRDSLWPERDHTLDEVYEELLWLHQEFTPENKPET